MGHFDRNSGGRLRLGIPGRGKRGAGMAALSAAVLLGAAGCGSSSTPSGGNSGGSSKPITLALVLDDLTNPVEAPLRRGAQDAASQLGFTLKTVGPSPATAQAQISLMQDLQAQKVTGVVILPVDSSALVPAINNMVAAGIPVATTEIDAPDSNRLFYYFGGSMPLNQGKIQADKVFTYLRSKGATGTVNYVVTSCLPTVTGQQQRRQGFEQEVTALNSGSPFQLTETGFYNTSTDPAKNLANIQNIYTAHHSDIKVAYAMCGPDTQNWGTVLKNNTDTGILVAGYDWLPTTLDHIQQGYVGWSLGSSLYQEGFHTFSVMYQHFAHGASLPTGVTTGTSTFATKANIDQVRNSPDVKYAQG
jgi:ABC-type sugar transport system substrate-binding protein